MALPFPDDDRLDSWKEIASYLARDVRTVQRWERREGLPIHRHQHDKLASVYASKSELRSWQAARQAIPDTATAVDVSGSRPTLWRSLAIAGLVGVVLVACFVSIPREVTPSAPASVTRVRMLQSDVDLPEGLREMRPAIHAAIAQAWRDAGGELLPDSAARTTLPLMRRSSEHSLTPGIAREVALRAGGVHVVLEPRVSPTADGYGLTLVAWAGPEAIEEVARLTTRSAADPGVLTNQFVLLTRKAVGALRSTTRVPTAGLPRVTTRSIEALHQFADADRMMKRSLWEPALPLLRRAIEADPDFASAYIHLAWTMSNLRRPESEWRPLLDRATQLQDVTAEPDKWFVAGSYHQLSDQRDDAVAAYERMLTVVPDHYWALGNLAILHRMAGQHEAAARLVIRRARAHPDSFISQYVAADVASEMGDRQAARGFRSRVTALVGDASASERWIFERWLPLFDTCDAWQRRDVVGAAAAADAMRTMLMADREADSYWYYRLGLAYLDLGMTRRAEEVFAMPATQRDRYQYLAMAAAARNDWPRVREQLLDFSTYFERPEPAAGDLLVEADLLPQADQLIARWDREQYWPERVLAPFRAALFVARGRDNDARHTIASALPASGRPLQPGAENMPTVGLPVLGALRVESRLHRKSGELAQAVATLEQADVSLGSVCTAYRSAGFLWITLRAELAALYRQLGKADDATAIEADLAERLALADRDHAVLAALGTPAKR